jgi:drug/metabolite transporter (DMT)-like permease
MNALTSLLQRGVRNGVLFAVLSSTGFSLKAVFVKLSYQAAQIDAITVLAIRMGLALPLFLWLIWLSRSADQPRLTGNDIVRILMLGLIGYYLSSLFDFYGLQYISTGLERLILFTYPTLVLVMQIVALGERPTRRTLGAMGLCYIGLGVALVHDLQQHGAGGQMLIGAAWVFASAVSYALYYLGTGVMIRRVGSTRLAGFAGSVSSVMVLIHFAMTRDLHVLSDLPAPVWIYGGLMAVVSTVLPIYWMALAIQRMGATHTAAFGNLGPVLTIFASWLALNEAISVFQLIGLALVIFGVSRLSARKAVKPVETTDSVAIPSQQKQRETTP